MIARELSLWEIAHRWHSTDAQSDTPPWQVLDTIRWLVECIEYELLNAVDYRYEDVLHLEDLEHGLEHQFRSAFENLPNLVHETREGNLSRKLLNGIFIHRDNLLKLCEHEGIDPPSFWFENGAASKGLKAKGGFTNSQEDRIRCRALASLLWEQNSTLTLEEMKKHPTIMKHGNGAAYIGKNTIARWIRDLNPTPPEKRRGRKPKPKK